ncbi:MAG: sugar transferase [Sphingomonas sp.]
MITRTETTKSGFFIPRKPLLDRRIIQFSWGLLLSVILPGTIVYLIWPEELLNAEGLRNSVVASFVAFVGGLLWYRRLVRYPGVQGLENVLTVFIATFALAAATLPMARLDYNRTFLFSSFLFTLTGFAVIAARQGLNAHPHFQIVPYGSTDRLLQISRAKWTIMTQANLPEGGPAGIVVDLRADLPDAWQRMIADAVLVGIPVFHMKQIEEALSGRVDIEHMSENQFGLLAPSPEYRNLKTVIDFVVSVLLLPLLIMPFLLIAAAIKLDSRGPIFFKQPRVGHRGRVFEVYKFRTMHDTQLSPDGDDARSDAMTKAGDARITRIGRTLRRYRIDEVSQIINVLKGEMSWIGPRPEAVPLSEWYASELPFYQYRHILKPGITGWAQVNQGHVTDLDDAHDKLRFDFYYIKYFSTWIDLLIVIRTCRILISGFGAK